MLWRPNVDAHEEKVRSQAWIYPRSAKLYVDKVEFCHLSIREGIQSFVEKVDRSLMNLDTYPRIGKPFISTFKSFFGFSSHSQVQPIHSGVTMMLCSAASRCSERLGTRCLIEEHRSLFFALRKTSVIYRAGVRTFPFFWARKIQKTSLNVNVSIFSRYMLIQCL